MNLPNKIKSIEPNYHRDDAIRYLERWFDEWSNDGDWWGGTNRWDINVFSYDEDRPSDYTINVYGLVKYDDDSVEIDTSNDIDYFELKL